jgi:hypothetical protein
MRKILKLAKKKIASSQKIKVTNDIHTNIVRKENSECQIFELPNNFCPVFRRHLIGF